MVKLRDIQSEGVEERRYEGQAVSSVVSAPNPIPRIQRAPIVWSTLLDGFTADGNENTDHKVDRTANII